LAGYTGYTSIVNALPNIYQAAIYRGGNTYYDKGNYGRRVQGLSPHTVCLVLQ